MTESIYVCASSFCCCLVVCALLRIISPSGNTSKIMSVVLGIFALCSLLYPVYDIVRDIDFSEDSSDVYKITSDEFSEMCDQQVLKETSDYINKYAKALLSQAEVVPKNIETVIAVSDNTGIYVKDMNIYITKSDWNKSEEINELIYSAMGVEPNILMEQ